jgi:hypothetical protein
MGRPASPIHLIPLMPSVPPAVLATVPGHTLFVCDSYVEGVEHGEDVEAGYRLGRVINVDHHAPTARMARTVSSANLAIAHVRQCGAATPADAVVITHTDCDSVLSSAIVAGLLPPEDRYGAAAIAADHTGAADDIADLLQALDERRDLALSLSSLARLEGRDPQPLEADVAAVLAARRRHRDDARAAVAAGRLAMLGPVAFGEFDTMLDGEFFPALVPDATVVVIACPMPDTSGRRQIKIRLGQAAPAGFSLHDLRLREFDPVYGGRWNAASNRRGGGTTIDAGRYAAEVRRRVEAALRGEPIR